MSESLPYRVGVIADTHGYLNPKVLELFEGVDLILHAGDVGRDDLLVDLRALAPVKAVSGNVDGTPTGERPLFQELDTPAGKMGMTHGHLPGAASTHHEGLVAHFQKFAPEVIIFGHSHIPHLSRCNGTMLFNPGAAGHARFGRKPTVGMLTRTAAREALEARHLDLE